MMADYNVDTDYEAIGVQKAIEDIVSEANESLLGSHVYRVKEEYDPGKPIAGWANSFQVDENGCVALLHREFRWNGWFMDKMIILTGDQFDTVAAAMKKARK
jgi:hypothetical protein